MDFFLGAKFLTVVLFDVLLGDPRWFPHPVRLMGGVIQRVEKVIFALCHGPCTRKLGGVVLALVLPYGCYVLVRELIWYMDSLNEVLGILIWLIFGYTTLAARDLWVHGMAVYQALTKHGLSESRVAVSQLVGRDTKYLSEPDVVRATIESIAENTSDGFVAPLFYLALGGPPLAMAYKAVNTLDSMIGHRNVRYRDVGWASARLDDVVNWAPARLTAVGMSLAAALQLRRGKASWGICWRDAKKHLSPNSGWPEAAMAGALGLRLGGVNEYAGVVEDRAALGDPVWPLTSSQIPKALKLMGLTSIFLVAMFLMMVMVW